MSAPRAAAPRTTRVRTPKQRAGDAAEEAACRYLAASGCRIVARNVRYRTGELDVIAEDAGTLVFIEVRMRGRGDFGGAAASVDFFKRRRLIRAAQQYLAQAFAGRSRRQLPPCRFDVVTADANGVSEWIRNAFGLD
jgi:putative endonuclease